MSRMYFLEPGVSAEDYEQRARDVAARKHESLKRNDGDLEDCFVSDRCADLLMQVYRMLAELARAGGKHPFTRLKTLDGKPVRAKVIFNRYGRSVWAVMDEAGEFAAFAPYKPARALTLARRGYVEVEEELPAAVRLVGGGSGTAGLAGIIPLIVMDTRRKQP